MAGLLRNCRYCRVLLAVMTLILVGTVLISTNLWNPLPQVSTWWANFTRLAEPAPRWDARASGVPDVAAMLSTGQVVVASRGFADAYDAGTGQVLWHYDVYWTLPAVDVVVIRQRPKNPDKEPGHDLGFSVVDPGTGAVLWGDREAKAVWAFADKIIDLSCPSAGGCQLRARLHRDNGRLLWSVPLPAGARTVIGPNPALPATRDPADWFATAATGTPDLLPPVLGITVDGRVQLVDTASGELLREVAAPDRQTRVSVLGERVLLSGAAPGASGCRFWVEALDAQSGASQWRKEGYDLDTASGAGCEQRKDPLGAGRHLVATSGGNAPVILQVDKGTQVWAGIPGDRVLATDGELAVVQGADRKTVRVLDLVADGTPAVWTQDMGVAVQAAVTRDLVIIRDADKGRIIVLSHRPLGKLTEFKTKADVVGYGPHGLLLASGRRIGFVLV